MTRIAVALALALALAAPAEAAKRRPPPDVVEDALAYAESDRAKAIQLLQTALDDGVSSRDVDVVAVHLAEQHRLAGQAEQAREGFVAVLQRTRKGVDHEAARLGAALVDATSAIDRKVVDVLLSVHDKEALPTQNADRYLALSLHAANDGNDKQARSWADKALSWATEDAAQRARVEATLAASSERGRDEAPEGVSLEPSQGGGEGLVAAEEAWVAGNVDKARRLAQRVANGSDELQAERARGLLRALDGAPVDTRSIAVLLPLSGKYAAVGEQVREALEFGYGSAPRSLVPYDSGATPESAVAALEKAVLQDGVIAVVGPLLSDETDAVVAAAEALHVPLLSLSQSYEDTTDARYAMQGMYTRRDQIRALLDHVIETKGKTRFAMFHPDNSFGTHAAETFRQIVADKGGELVTEASYSATDENILPFARKLGTRQGNLRQLREEAEKRGGNPDTVVVPPVIDFDALFLPESATRTPLAAAALAYEEFPMGEFLPTRDSPEVPLLGLSSWNTPNLITQGNEYTRNSLFPDVFSAAAGTDEAFAESYRASTGRTPSALEAATVDVGKLLAEAASANADARPTFRQALLDARVDDAVTGATHIHPETMRAVRQMHILTITRTDLESVAVVPLDADGLDR
jgi:ABC-type branched-subunit amino acid transport system substrate-binding protein